MVAFQIHLVARVDDCSKVAQNLKRSTQCEDLLTVRLAWSKNVHEEKRLSKTDDPGSRNPKFCVLLNLSLFLKKWLQDGDRATSQWLFANGRTDQTSAEDAQDKETERCKTLCTKMQKSILDDTTVFERSLLAGKLGTHSIRKYAATVVRKCSIPKDNLNHRARWKSKQIQDTYVGMELKAGLTFLVQAIYKAREGLGLTDDWMSRFVAPAITAAFDEGVGAVLGQALLWACMNPVVADLKRG